MIASFSSFMPKPRWKFPLLCFLYNCFIVCCRTDRLARCFHVLNAIHFPVKCFISSIEIIVSSIGLFNQKFPLSEFHPFSGEIMHYMRYHWLVECHVNCLLLITWIVNYNIVIIDRLTSFSTFILLVDNKIKLFIDFIESSWRHNVHRYGSMNFF